MQIFFLILTGLASGILGGMGMGGGTILIPALTMLFHFPQQLSQGINLLSFLPMSVLSILLHMKHKLIRYKVVLAMAPGGVALSVLGAYLAGMVDRLLLRRLFGGFIILIGLFQTIVLIVKKVRKKKV